MPRSLTQLNRPLQNVANTSDRAELCRCALQLWHLAKMHGEAADKATDAHFMRAARAHQALLGVHSRVFAPRQALCARSTCQANRQALL